MTLRSEINEKYDSWTKEHQKKAQAEGWDLFDYDGSGLLQIQKIDEIEAFESDKAAFEFVLNKADEGDEVAKLALALDRFFDPFIYEGSTIEEDVFNIGVPKS